MTRDTMTPKPAPLGLPALAGIRARRSLAEPVSGIRRFYITAAFCLSLTVAAPVFASDSFDAANKLYFEGKFAEAAAAYEKLLQSDPESAVLYFNLGNACFKAGQKGRAIAAYLRAQQLEPRDPALRFNLKFVREKVTGSDKPVGTPWQRALAGFTLNEWTTAAVAAFWMLCLLLALRELRPALRSALRNYAMLAGLLTVLLTGCCAAAYAQARVVTAVVAAPEVVVRNGPLERSPSAFKLPDGSEVLVQDQQEITDQSQKQTWYQVQDAAKRIGWVRREAVIVLNSKP